MPAGHLRVRAASFLVVACLLGFTGCASSDTPPAAEPSSPILTMELPPDVSATGVVSAAVLLGTADIERAVSEGLVTPAEVAEAEKALAEGTLRYWVERAEAE